MKTLEDRFWEKVRKGDDDACWEWAGSINNTGYGAFRAHGKTVLAHRFAWSLAHGADAPADMQVLHHCDNPPCCNPAHFFLGTHTDNMRDCASKGRNVQSKKTHCPNGHAYDAENTAIEHGSRACRECHRQRKSARYHRTKVLIGRAAKTHCVRGHAFDTINTRIGPDGSRTCKACVRMHQRVSARRKAAGTSPVPLKERTHCSAGHAYTEANTHMSRGKRCCRACGRAWAAKRAARHSQPAD